MLPSGMHRPWAEPTDTKFRSYFHSLLQGHPQAIHPHNLSVYASRYDFNQSLIRTLQHSIRGAWLTLTTMGFSPTSQSDLASPHVHRIVIRRLSWHCSWNHQYPKCPADRQHDCTVKPVGVRPFGQFVFGDHASDQSNKSTNNDKRNYSITSFEACCTTCP